MSLNCGTEETRTHTDSRCEATMLPTAPLGLEVLMMLNDAPAPLSQSFLFTLFLIFPSVWQLFIFRTIKAEGVDFTQCATHGSFQQHWQETAYNMFQFVTLYVFPLLVMSFCYTRILVEINRQMNRSKDKGEWLSFLQYYHTIGLIQGLISLSNVSLAGEPCLRRSGTDMIPKARMKTLKMTIIIVASFVICWTPYYLLGIWYWFQPQMLQVIPEYVHHVFFVFGNLNTCSDPVIYGLFTPSFRADLASCFCWRRQNASLKSLDQVYCHRKEASGEAESDLGSGDQPSGQQA